MNSELPNWSTTVQISDCFMKKINTRNSLKKYKIFMNSQPNKISPNFGFSFIKREPTAGLYKKDFSSKLRLDPNLFWMVSTKHETVELSRVNEAKSREELHKLWGRP